MPCPYYAFALASCVVSLSVFRSLSPPKTGVTGEAEGDDSKYPRFLLFLPVGRVGVGIPLLLTSC